MERKYVIVNAIIMILIVLTGCSKDTIRNHKTFYGKATINGLELFDYRTLEESITPLLWYINLSRDRIKITEDNICYMQMFLRKDKDPDPYNYCMILIGIPVNDEFPVLNKEYTINYIDDIEYGKRNSTFEYTKELEKLIRYNNSISYGIAGIETPTSDRRYLPLKGTLSFYKYDSKTETYYISYTLETLNISDALKYNITGDFYNKLRRFK